MGTKLASFPGTQGRQLNLHWTECMYMSRDKNYFHYCQLSTSYKIIKQPRGKERCKAHIKSELECLFKKCIIFTEAHIFLHNTNNRSISVMVTGISFWCLFHSHCITWGKGTFLYSPQCKMGKRTLLILIIQGFVEFNEKLYVNYLDLCLVGWWLGLGGKEQLSSSQQSVAVHLTSLLPQEGHLLKPGPPPASGIYQETQALPQIRFSSWESVSLHLDPTFRFPGSQSFGFPSISSAFQVLHMT